MVFVSVMNSQLYFQDSNRRRVFINHDTRIVSLQRPSQQEQQQHLSRTREFLPRMHSVEEAEVNVLKFV